MPPAIHAGRRKRLLKRRGELSRGVLEASNSASIRRIPLVDINIEIKVPEVNMFIPTELWRKIRTAAERRGVSRNIIVNSTRARWRAKRGLVEISPI